ncbi:MAG: FAD-dependent oxidoreductase [Rhodospirillaceae bacterium]|nr:FAD-dependent oxidoreductase [Rhodospirillaceae bacterium]
MNPDFLVVGAGVAGASVSALLSEHGDVVLLEREELAGYHTTGRSAAFFTTNYGNSTIRRLTEASRLFFENPPDGFSDSELMSPHRILTVARGDQRANFVQSFATAQELGSDICRVATSEAEEMCPILRKGYCSDAYLEQGMYMDVSAIHSGFLRKLKLNGGSLLCQSELLSLQRKGDLWFAHTNNGTYQAPILVNAAGAWADQLGALAGAKSIGLVPKRRTVIIFSAPGELVPDNAPMVMDVDEEFYFKPEAGKILASPADETPSLPCDVQPEEIDIAVTISRVEQAMEVSVGQIEHKWAGLRSFVADKTPVVGFDPNKDGFFWLAGQGGYGIMTSPAIAEAATALILGNSWPASLDRIGVDAGELAPGRGALF